jgi:polysaccharide deacetylase family protein (PEP-CTERM system associated)
MTSTVAGTEGARARTRGHALAAFSADVEDYFQVESLRGFCPRDRWTEFEDRTEASTRRVLSVLDRLNAKGTFYILGWTAERHPELVAEIAAAGHEVASHGYDHELIYNQTPEAFRDDIRRARSLLQRLSGQEILGYRAPSYTIVTRTRWALPILVEEGHRYSSSVFPIMRKRYGIPNAPRFPHRVSLDAGRSITEFPLPTVRLGRLNVPATGGAYLRLLPLGFQTWALRRFLQAGQPFVINVHPWELDPDQPRFRTSGRTRITHYHNLHRTESRLCKLLSLSEFRRQDEILRDLNLL